MRPATPITKEKALQRLQTLCCRAEQCEHDITQKLYVWRLPATERREIIEFLKENRYIDDFRYAKSFAHDKARFSGWGPNKINIELRKKRIPAPQIKEALSLIDNDVWKESLIKNASAKSRHLDLIGEEEYNNRQKLFRYLVSRGFPSSASSKAVTLMASRQRKEAENNELSGNEE